MAGDKAGDMVLEAYEQWLIEECGDELHTKDQLIEASEDAYRVEDFYKFVKSCI